jgi:hypothetical protein
MYALLFLFCQEFLVGRIYGTHVSFLEKMYLSLILPPYYATMIANNHPANQPANVGHQQQQAHQHAGNKAPQCSSTEVQGHLKVIEEVLLVHGEEWDDVSQAHAASFPTSQCTADSLKHKSQQLYRLKKPTGDPFCPPGVRMAKHLCHLIMTKFEIEDEGGPLPPDFSFDDDITGDKNVVEEGDDEIGASNDVVLAPAPPAAHGNGVLAPLPQNFSAIAVSRMKAAFKSKSNNILEVYKLKILQKDEEREAERERYEREHEERASEMRMHHEEERRFRHESEMRKAEAEAQQAEMKAEAESHRKEGKAFCKMKMIMLLGKKKQDASNN